MTLRLHDPAGSDLAVDVKADVDPEGWWPCSAGYVIPQRPS